MVIAVLVAASGGITVPKAMADTYPSWGDVQAARSNEAAKQAQVYAITALISSLKTQVKAAEDAAAAREREHEVAQFALTTGQKKADLLTATAAQLKTKSETSHRQAATVMAKFARTGGQSVTGTLLTSTSADRTGLLYRLGLLGMQLLDVDPHPRPENALRFGPWPNQLPSERGKRARPAQFSRLLRHLQPPSRQRPDATVSLSRRRRRSQAAR
ncbi:hypothetical protein KNO15_07440 [Leifsonia shinshuensis]|uniref:hypothetical protein n=1 Tax=Leifsonia shinshuensis TaxID=150026 RepID=UPI001F5046DA|nr:hypothetical protein [Leifsonia shinshuensis]MCI0156528.1 hypothetical protein [Leifsonia shinshuensis]